jgi:hypothetical protein
VALLAPTNCPPHKRRHWDWGRCLSFLGALGLLLLPGSSAWAQPITAPEPQVQAAFLYNFTKLVTWPTNAFASPSAPIIIGVLGKDPVGPALESVVKDKKVNGRPVQMLPFKTVAEIKICHVLFISKSERRRLDATLKTLRAQPILTVGALPGFESRGMIALIKSNETINLRINLEATTQAGLNLSSRLLRLDKTLKPTTGSSTNRRPPAPQ